MRISSTRSRLLRLSLFLCCLSAATNSAFAQVLGSGGVLPGTRPAGAGGAVSGPTYLPDGTACSAPSLAQDGNRDTGFAFSTNQIIACADGDTVLTVGKPTGAAFTSNVMRVVATAPAVLSATFRFVDFQFTAAASGAAQIGINLEMPGTLTGTNLVRVLNITNAMYNPAGGSRAMIWASSQTATDGDSWGIVGNSGGSTSLNVGVMGSSKSNSSVPYAIGVWGEAEDSTKAIAGLFTFEYDSADVATFQTESAVIYAINADTGDVADKPLFIGQRGVSTQVIRIEIDGSVESAARLQTGVTTVAALPTCNAAAKGSRLFVTDANAAHTAGIGAVVAAGGANNVPVVCDGTNWRIG